jgi:hypothetical protein
MEAKLVDDSDEEFVRGISADIRLDTGTGANTDRNSHISIFGLAPYATDTLMVYGDVTASVLTGSLAGRCSVVDTVSGLGAFANLGGAAGTPGQGVGLRFSSPTASVGFVQALAAAAGQGSAWAVFKSGPFAAGAEAEKRSTGLSFDPSAGDEWRAGALFRDEVCC